MHLCVCFYFCIIQYNSILSTTFSTERFESENGSERCNGIKLISTEIRNNRGTAQVDAMLKV